jgi:hypothetical protein
MIDLTKPVKYSKSRFLKALKMQLKENGLKGVFDFQFVDNDHHGQNIIMKLKWRINVGPMRYFYIDIGLLQDGFGFEPSRGGKQIIAGINERINQYYIAGRIIKGLSQYLEDHLECSILESQSVGYRCLFQLQDRINQASYRRLFGE